MLGALSLRRIISARSARNVQVGVRLPFRYACICHFDCGCCVDLQFVGPERTRGVQPRRGPLDPRGRPRISARYEDWIVKTGPLPDSWRGPSEPYSKIFEDPNHGWFKEQFAFMKTIPHSRYEFVHRLYDEYLRVKDKDPARAALLNVRWTGTPPYAAMENYDRVMRATGHLSRRTPNGPERTRGTWHGTSRFM